MEHRETKTKGQTRSDNVKHGIFPDLVGVESVTKGLVMESMHVPISVTNTTGSETKFVNVPVCVEPKLVEANLNLSHPMHMVTKEHAGNGPTKTKTKPTWTRQARMDCELKNTICAATKPIWEKEQRHVMKLWLYWELKAGRRREARLRMTLKTMKR